MAYMLFERVAMEIVAAYRDRPDAQAQLDAAATYRQWVEGLQVDSAIRADLVEPIAALEEGFREAIRRRQPAATSGGVDLDRLWRDPGWMFWSVPKALSGSSPLSHRTGGRYLPYDRRPSAESAARAGIAGQSAACGRRAEVASTRARTSGNVSMTRPNSKLPNSKNSQSVTHVAVAVR